MEALSVAEVMAGAEDSFGVGSSVGPYVLVRQIGQGGMGSVYEGVHRSLEKRVAIKALHLRFGDDPVARERFHREGRAAARVRHPNAVEVFDCGIEQGVAWLAMEYLDGEDLATALEREGVLAVSRLVDLMLPVIAAVAAAHQEGIVHRDLKPENIFLAHTPHGMVVPKVLDFGVARVLDDDVGITRSTTLLGTPYYMSPEQTVNGKSATVLSDQYALGVMLYECATGQVPFDRNRLYELMAAIVRGPLTPPRAIRPDLPAEFEEVVLRAMSRAPGRRFPTLRAFGHALLPFASPGQRATWEPVFDVDTHHRTIVTYDELSLEDFGATISDAQPFRGEASPAHAAASAVRPVVSAAQAPALVESSIRRVNLPVEPAIELPMKRAPRGVLAALGALVTLGLVAAAFAATPKIAWSTTQRPVAPASAALTGLVAIPVEPPATAAPALAAPAAPSTDGAAPAEAAHAHRTHRLSRRARAHR